MTNCTNWFSSNHRRNTEKKCRQRNYCRVRDVLFSREQPSGQTDRLLMILLGNERVDRISHWKKEISSRSPQNGALLDANRILTIHGLGKRQRSTRHSSQSIELPRMGNAFNSADNTRANDRLIECTTALNG